MYCEGIMATMAKVLCNTRVAESTPGFQKKVWIASGIKRFRVNTIYHFFVFKNNLLRLLALFLGFH